MAQEHLNGPGTQAPASFPFSWLREGLAAQGLRLNVEQTLRLEALVGQLPLDMPPERLKYLIAPIVVTDRAQQAHFYEACDAFLAAYSDAAGPTAPEVRRPVRAPRRQRTLWLTSTLVLVLATLGLIAYSLSHTTRTIPAPRPRSSAAPRPRPAESLVRIRIQPDERAIVPRRAAGPTSLRDRSIFWFLLSPALGGSTLLWGLRRPRSRRHRSLPLRWPLTAPFSRQSLFSTSQIMETARQMRTPRTVSHAGFDSERSIDQTIQAGGFPTPVIRITQRSPEYLILIDRRSARDHLANFYAELVQTFRREGVHARYLFFDDDIRRCRLAEEATVDLAQLASRYGSHRLLIVSRASCLLDPITGRSPEWTRLFLTWKERALFLVEPFPPPAVQELEATGLFQLFPASLDGLQNFLDRLAAGERGDAVDQMPAELAADAPPYLPAACSVEHMRALHRYLGGRAYLWLCTCALYSELRWSLTLYLGMLLPEPQTRDDALRLVQLPWFRAGAIPDEWREQLILQLPPEIAVAARRALVGLLEKAPPPPGSYAEAEFLLEVATQRWAADPTPHNRRRLGMILREMAPSDILGRRVLMRLLTQTPGPTLLHRLNHTLRQRLYREGVPELGPRRSARLIGAGLLGLTGCLVVLWTPSRSDSSLNEPSPLPLFLPSSSALSAEGFPVNRQTSLAFTFDNRTEHPVTLRHLRLESPGTTSVYRPNGPAAATFTVPAKTAKVIEIGFLPTSIGAFQLRLRFDLALAHSGQSILLTGYAGTDSSQKR